jgi:DNA-binding protein H-NS
MMEFEGKSAAEIVALVQAAQERLEAIRKEKNDRLISLINEVKEYCTETGIEPHTLFPKPAKVREPSDVMYRGSDDGQAWSGKGRKPAWLALKLFGKTEDEQAEILESLRVKDESPASIDPETGF